MGRLFWKFFLAFLLAQGLAAIALFLTIAIVDGSWSPRPPEPPPRFLPDDWRMVDPESGVRWELGPPTGPPPGVPGFGPPPSGHGPPPPYLPMLAILLGCLSASALLAWYFAKPVRNLRWALGAVAEGRLDTRIQSRMGHRRDEASLLKFDPVSGLRLSFGSGVVHDLARLEQKIGEQHGV
ncbi:hypothetical protein CCR95_06275 [Thiocystis minor]|uniref:HAMP domain-containing protein n=1 Tax=Thiocystis minor TaxID=61597 RepID=UPI00191149C8|nr:hypothetical protein [Thiocystis minor]MBK5963700.1 hypothetical protein [Thiocystis minor]